MRAFICYFVLLVGASQCQTLLEPCDSTTDCYTAWFPSRAVTIKLPGREPLIYAPPLRVWIQREPRNSFALVKVDSPIGPLEGSVSPLCAAVCTADLTNLAAVVMQLPGETVRLSNAEVKITAAVGVTFEVTGTPPPPPPQPSKPAKIAAIALPRTRMEWVNWSAGAIDAAQTVAFLLAGQHESWNHTQSAPGNAVLIMGGKAIETVIARRCHRLACRVVPLLATAGSMAAVGYSARAAGPRACVAVPSSTRATYVCK